MRGRAICIPGSTGSLPVVPRNLRGTILAGRLPARAGWQPALPGNRNSAAQLLP